MIQLAYTSDIEEDLKHETMKENHIFLGVSLRSL